MKSSRFVLMLLLGILESGCASNFDTADFQGLQQVGPDVYEVFYEDHRGVFGSEKSLQKRVISEANSFADNRGMSAKPVDARQHRVGILGDWAWAYYKFTLVPRSELRLSPGHLQITFIGDARMSNNFLETKDQNTKAGTNDLYTELMKLDDLRKQGVLTEEEFLAEKRKLLNR